MLYYIAEEGRAVEGNVDRKGDQGRREECRYGKAYVHVSNTSGMILLIKTAPVDFNPIN